VNEWRTGLDFKRTSGPTFRNGALHRKGAQMSKLSIGPIGIALNVSADDSHLKQAAELEELGYSTIWLPGGQIDRLDRLAAVIEATTSVPVGSAIIPVDHYEPGAVAGLHARVPGRSPTRSPAEPAGAPRAGRAAA
jgi:hypothetical protein